MNREVSRAILKELHRQSKQDRNKYDVDIARLKSKIVDKEGICSLMFMDEGFTFNMASILSIFKSLLDNIRNITYLDDYLIKEYSHYTCGKSDKLLDMRELSSVISNMDGDTDLGRLTSVWLTSLYVFNDNLDEDFKDFYTSLGGNILLAHKNIIGISLLLKANPRLKDNAENLVVEDIIGCYVNMCSAIKIITTSLGNKRSGLLDVLNFMCICLKHFIDMHSECGVTSTLHSKVFDADLIEYYHYLHINGVGGLSSDYLRGITTEIRDNTVIVLDSLFCTINDGVELGIRVSKKDKEQELKELQNNHLKDLKELEKDNSILSKKLKDADKSLNKLQKYLDKKNASNKVDEYKKRIEELELKNKQLESKLEGANLRIETLEDRVSVLKGDLDAANRLEVAINSESVISQDSVIENEVNLDTMLGALKDLNIVIVGGTDTSYKRISNHLSNVRYIDAENTANFDIPLNTDYVVLCTKILSHSHTRRAEVFSNSVKGIIKTNKTNPTEILKEVYNIVTSNIESV